MPKPNSTEHLINRSIGRQGTVEDAERSLEPLWDVVAASTWVDHRCNHVDVDQGGKFAGLLKVVEAVVFHHLSRDLIGHLYVESFWIHYIFGIGAASVIDWHSCLPYSMTWQGHGVNMQQGN